MIPEPDYSDSSEESEDEEEKRIRPSNTRSTIQRFRDFTEIYMTKVDAKKKPTASKKAATISAAKAGPKKTKVVSKDSSGKAKTPTKKSPKSSPGSPAAPRKHRSKSPTSSSEAKSRSGRSKSPKAVRKSPSKSKSGSPTRQKQIPTESQHTKSKPEDKRDAIKPHVKKEASKTKTTPKKSSEQSSPADPKKQESNLKIKSETLNKRTDKTVLVVSKETAAVKKEAGDTSVAHLSSPSPEKPRSFSSGISTEHSSDEEQFIKPKKPYQPSTEKLKLHKELKFTQKYGKLSSSKTELQLALERYTENKAKRELDAAEKTSLEKILELQAKKVEMHEAMDKTPAWVDRLQRPPSTLPDPKTEEFYRVHARVVSNNILAQCFQPDNIQCDSLQSKSLCSSESASDS